MTGDGSKITWNGSAWVVVPVGVTITPASIATAATGAQLFTINAASGLLPYASFTGFPSMMLYDPNGPTVLQLVINMPASDTTVDFHKISGLIVPGLYSLRFRDVNGDTVADFPGLLEVTA